MAATGAGWTRRKPGNIFCSPPTAPVPCCEGERSRYQHQGCKTVGDLHSYASFELKCQSEGACTWPPMYSCTSSLYSSGCLYLHIRHTAPTLFLSKLPTSEGNEGKGNSPPEIPADLRAGKIRSV